MFSCNHNNFSNVPLNIFYCTVLFAYNHLFAQLYNIIYSYLILTIFKEIYSTHRWDSNRYYFLIGQGEARHLENLTTHEYDLK